MNMVQVSEKEMMEVDGGIKIGPFFLGAVVGGATWDGVKAVAKMAYNEHQTNRRNAPRHPGWDNSHGDHLKTGFTF